MGSFMRLANHLAVAACAATLAQAQCDYPLKPPRIRIGPSEVRARYSNLIFRIFAVHGLGTNFVVDQQGTAFAIDPGSGYFLTAQHVVEGLDQNGSVFGDLESTPGKRFKFEVVMKLCKQEFQGECKSQSGDDSDVGVDVALLKMSGDDLKEYLSEIGRAQTPLDLTLSSQPPDEAFKAGFPMEGNPAIPASLNPSAQMVVVRDWGIGDHALKHGQWKLDRSASPGESGSPVMDGSGNVFAVLLEQDPTDANKGISVNLLEALELLKRIFKEMPRTSVGDRLSHSITSNGYKSEAEAARDLNPVFITNKELSAVILEVTESGPPPFRFKHCPVDIALNERGLDGIYGAWERDQAEVDLNQQRTVLLRDANGLLASGLVQAAANRYEAVLNLRPVSKASTAVDLISVESALGAARAYGLIQDSEREKQYSELAMHLAYKQGSMEHVALASAYRYDAALADGDQTSAIRDAKTSFIQAPSAIYGSLGTVEDKEKFRVSTSKKLSAEEWQGFMNVQQTALENKLLDSVAVEAPSSVVQ